jgi:hypothetical protein
MSKALRASVLLLLLTSSAQAGWMGNDVKQPPPTSAVQEATTDGLIPNEEPESLTETVLAMLESVLSLL